MTPNIPKYKVMDLYGIKTASQLQDMLISQHEKDWGFLSATYVEGKNGMMVHRAVFVRIDSAQEKTSVPTSNIEMPIKEKKDTEPLIVRSNDTIIIHYKEDMSSPEELDTIMKDYKDCFPLNNIVLIHGVEQILIGKGIR